MALAAGLHGAVRLSFCRAGKINQFGVNFKVRIIVDNEVVRPFRKISGKVVIETRFPIKHKGIQIQFESLCTLRYAIKFDNKTFFHQGRECILEKTKKDTDGYQESPVRVVIISEEPISDIQTLLSVQPVLVISPGSHTFPFSLEIPGDQNLPAPFKNSLGNLVYRFVVYMKSSNGSNVEVGELILRFKGHNNLLVNADAHKPITMEQFYKKSMFTRKKLVDAVFSIETSGFLSEESIPFVLYVKNPKCIPLQLSVQLIQQLKYDASGRRDAAKRRSIIVAVKEKDFYDLDEPSLTWIDCLQTKENQEPTFTCHSMYNVTYCIQFKVKILDHGTIKGEAPIIIGTTRDPVTVLMNAASYLDVPFQGIRRRGSVSSAHSVRSHNSATTTYSLPPAYSELSSRIPSTESLPPAYEEVDFFNESQDLTFEVPQFTPTDRYLDQSPDEDKED